MAVSVTGGSLDFVADIDTSAFDAKLTALQNKLAATVNDGTANSAQQQQQIVASAITQQTSVASNSIKNLADAYAQLYEKQEALKAALAKPQGAQSIQDLNSELASTRTQMQAVAVAIKAISPEPIVSVDNAIKNTTTSATSAFAQLRLLKNQLALLSASGQQGSPAFQELLEQATELEHALKSVNASIELSASNVAGIQALGEGVRGLMGAFEALQGAMAFLSDGTNEQLERTIKDMTAIIAVMQGLSEFGNTVNKASSLNVYLRQLIGTSEALKEETAATVENTAAQDENNVTTGVAVDNSVAQAEASTAVAEARQVEATATEEATGATLELNAAMELNPAAILLVALTGIVAAIQLFSNDTKDATEEQKKLNDAISAANNGLIELSSLYKEAYADNTQNAQVALALAQARNASDSEMYGLQQKVNEAKKLENTFTLSTLGITGQNTDELEKQVVALRDSAIYKKEILQQLQSAPDTNKDALERAKQESEDAEKIYSAAATSLNGIKSAQTETLAAASANQERIQDQSLKSAIAYWEARAEAAKKGSIEERDATIALSKAQLQQTLSDPNITTGEKAKANQDQIETQKQANLKYNLAQIEMQQDLIKAKLALTKEGSAEEYNLQLQLLQKNADAEIAQAQDNATKIQAIKATTAKAVSDLTKKYDYDNAKSELNASLAFDEKVIATAKAGSEEELDFKKQQIQDKAALDILDAQNQIKNAQELAARILAIQAKSNHDQLALDDAFVITLLDKKKAGYEADVEAANTAAASILADPNSSSQSRFKAEIAQLNNKLNDDLYKELKDTNDQLKNATGDMVDVLTERRIKIQKQIDATNKAIGGLGKQEKAAQLAKTAQDISDLSSSLASLASSLQDVNPGLADTLNTLSQIGAVAGDATKALSEVSTNPVAAVSDGIKVIAGIINIFSAAKKSQTEAQAAFKTYQDSLITGEVEYDELLRGRERTIQNINELTATQLQQQLQILATQKQQAQADEQKLLSLIQQSGQQITGETTQKYGGVLGIGRKTKTVQELAGLSNADYNQLEQLFTEGKLDQKTAAWFQELQKVHNELDDIGVSAQQAADQLNQILTGTTANSLADSIEQGFEKGYSSVEAFGSDINSVIRTAILSAFEVDYIKPAFAPLYQELADLNKDGTLSAGDIAKFTTDAQNALTPLVDQFNILKQAASSVFADTTAANQNSLIGAASSATEQTTELLAGQMGAQRLTLVQIMNISTQQLQQLNMIATYTADIPNLLALWRQINNNGIKIKG